MSDWFWNGSILLEPPEGAIGFVYLITDLENNKKYIGQKLFYSKVTKAPLKGKTKKRRSIKESDWRTYWSSSEQLKQIVADREGKGFLRQILYICENKASMNYIETKEQFERNVLFDDQYFNGIINCRIAHTQVKKLKEQWLSLNSCTKA